MTESPYPCLWFDKEAFEAATFYCSLFPNSKITSSSPMLVHWEIDGRKYMGLNGGPVFKMNEAISFVVMCETQEEIDRYWNTLTSNGGEESQCGWCKDKYGVSWQIIPAELSQWMSQAGKSERVIKAFMQMKKMDIEILRNA
jgi:predicted 3-demethylubiquinone-9 3-methyltransferase (glyoxalase superfamily)